MAGNDEPTPDDVAQLQALMGAVAPGLLDGLLGGMGGSMGTMARLDLAEKRIKAIDERTAEILRILRIREQREAPTHA